ncbi:MAG: Ppx/GppA family phosphatase [Verrucomicrobia bacterium]|nr:Ppx/GppA family phosphatase [Verrucomicrobiota bacterium]
MKRVGVIDVGTNSVKLLVADVDGSNVVPVSEESEQTRLGRGFYQTHMLQSSAIQQTAEAIAFFSGKATSQGAISVRVIATSAARDAKNADELLRAIQAASGLSVEVISGEQEADWAFRGVTSNPEFTQHPLLILDVGGGSTEFIIGEHGHQQFRDSFNLGTVRLLEQLPHSDPPKREELEECRAWVSAFLREKVVPKVKPALESCCDDRVQLVGTGGTSTILARIDRQTDSYDRDLIESTHLSHDRIRSLTEHLWSVPLAARQSIQGLPQKRADVILTGTIIYEAVMEQFGFQELRVSTRGLRFAAAMED